LRGSSVSPSSRSRHHLPTALDDRCDDRSHRADDLGDLVGLRCAAPWLLEACEALAEGTVSARLLQQREQAADNRGHDGRQFLLVDVAAAQLGEAKRAVRREPPLLAPLGNAELLRARVVASKLVAGAELVAAPKLEAAHPRILRELLEALTEATIGLAVRFA